MNTDEISANQIIELAHKTDSGLGERANLGIIVLSSDQTLEYEFRTLLNFEGVTLYHSRIPNEMEITKSSLAKMEADLPVAAALLPESFNLVRLVTAVPLVQQLLEKIALKKQFSVYTLKLRVQIL